MNKNIVIISLISILLLSANASSASNIPGEVSSKVCSATTKVCVSNVTNKLTVKDEELLNACKQCCTGAQLLSVKGCTNRCQKSCEKAYKKEIAKINKKG